MEFEEDLYEEILRCYGYDNIPINPPKSGPVARATNYSASEELRKQYSADDEVKKIIDIALGLEGLRRQDGIHAAAIVISPDKITNFLPLYFYNYYNLFEVNLFL